MAARTIVVGAGVLGLSVAERLAARGDLVTMVDRGEPGGGTSRTSFGWLNANNKVPFSYHRLNVEAVARYRALVGDPGVAPWLHLNGRLQWADERPDITDMDATVDAMRAWDYPVESITPDAARNLEPDLLIPDGAEVRFWPTEGFIIPPLFLDWLLARATSRGVVLNAGGAVSGFETGSGGRVAGVRLEDGSMLEADRVVVCVGRWTQDLLALVGVHVPMLPATAGSPSLGLLGYTSPSGTRLTRTITRHAISIRPDTSRDRYVLQGHGLDHLADPAGTTDPEGRVGREMLARAAHVLAGFAGTRLADLRIGYRAVPADRITVAGWAPGVDGLYVIATHSGFTLALHLGDLAAREVLDETTEPSLADFRPSRFGLPVAAGVAGRPIH